MRSTRPTLEARGATEMSDNYTLYAQKMAELRAAREANRPLSSQLEALFQLIRECEARWALEDRDDR
jgi:hypothetical protein